MRKMTTIAGLVSATFLFVGCQDAQEETTEAPETESGQTEAADDSQLDEDENDDNTDENSSDDEDDGSSDEDNEELEETLFLAGGNLEEQVTDENGEPLSFEETVETMKTVERDDAFYSSAIVEGIDIVGASIENGNASVQYTMDEEIVTEADRIVFETAIQLAALDFHAWEVKLRNDTVQEVITYQLVGQ